MVGAAGQTAPTNHLELSLQKVYVAVTQALKLPDHGLGFPTAGNVMNNLMLWDFTNQVVSYNSSTQVQDLTHSQR